MFKKKTLFLLGLGYLGGLAIALKYHKKTATSLREELAKTDKKCLVFWKHIVQIHQDLFAELKSTALSPENMEKLRQYKDKLLVHVEEFREDAMVKMEELKKKGVAKREEIEKELKKLYEHRMELLEGVKEKGLHLLDDAKVHGKEYFDEAKEKLAEAFEEFKKSLKK